MEHFSTQQILEALKMGHHDAYTYTYRTYHPLVREYLKRVTHITEDAEEIAQNVFMKLWLHREHINPEYAFKPYLYAIVRHELSNYYRRHTFVEYVDIAQQELASSQHSIDDYLYREDLQRFVDRKVEQMPQRRACIYRYSRVVGLSNECIALKLNISKNLVEKQLTYALRDIRGGII
ncbi:MAG: sigma-70 family RNA polymerase sigma factor [Mediterranea sp.]|jgi:RNA polymerase sigma-70 factor (ECF subfamily)|nr:sigma-70 family RNA polymerase sigma factor [Mediterranea sp.]